MVEVIGTESHQAGSPACRTVAIIGDWVREEDLARLEIAMHVAQPVQTEHPLPGLPDSRLQAPRPKLCPLQVRPGAREEREDGSLRHLRLPFHGRIHGDGREHSAALPDHGQDKRLLQLRVVGVAELWHFPRETPAGLDIFDKPYHALTPGSHRRNAAMPISTLQESLLVRVQDAPILGDQRFHIESLTRGDPQGEVRTLTIL